MGAASTRFAAHQILHTYQVALSITNTSEPGQPCMLEDPRAVRVPEYSQLPSLQAAEEHNSNHEALLLHALDDLANDPDFAPTMPTRPPIDGVLQNVSRLVDSSSC